MKLFRMGAFALLAVVAISLSSCNKYEEGSNFSLLSAKARLVNTWTVLSATANGTDISAGIPDNYTINKDGSYVATWTAGGLSVNDNGKWEFNSDKTQVTLTDSDGDQSVWKILMLKNKDLKVQLLDNTSIVTIITLEGE